MALYILEIGSKSISNLLSNRFGKVGFGIDLKLFGCTHKPIGIDSKSIWNSHVNRVLHSHRMHTYGVLAMHICIHMYIPLTCAYTHIRIRIFIRANTVCALIMNKNMNLFCFLFAKRNIWSDQISESTGWMQRTRKTDMLWLYFSMGITVKSSISYIGV